jgi:hypothetical protein
MGKTPVEGVKNIIAVGAGKGGVGKTTVAVNLAIALSQSGGRVAMIDGDIYGPNVPIMLGISTQLTTDGRKIVPAEQYGIQLVSMAFLTGDDAPVIWRGPMLHGVIQQFFREVRWRDIDYLIVDMPPGTGDVGPEPEPERSGRGERGRHDPPDGVRRRHAPGGPHVSEAERAHARSRREHESFRLSELPARGRHLRQRGRRDPGDRARGSVPRPYPDLRTDPGRWRHRRADRRGRA